MITMCKDSSPPLLWMTQWRQNMIKAVLRMIMLAADRVKRANVVRILGMGDSNGNIKKVEQRNTLKQNFLMCGHGSILGYKNKL